MTSSDAECPVHVFHAAVREEGRGALETLCESLLDEDELRGADRFRLDTSRNQHVVGRAMARRLLGEERIAPQTIRFSLGEHGKPFVAFPREAQRPFNIAHTSGLVVCGIGGGNVERVGIDVESTHRTTSPELAERYFSPPEIDFLKSCDRRDVRQSFLRIWTLKESFIKAIGTGLTTPLDQFAFEDIESERPRIRFLNSDLDDGRRWQFFCFQPRTGFIAAVALVSASDAPIEKIAIKEFEPLISPGATSEAE